MDWIPAKLGSGFYLLDSDELDQSESIGLASEFQSGKLISWIPDCGFPYMGRYLLKVSRGFKRKPLVPRVPLPAKQIQSHSINKSAST